MQKEKVDEEQIRLVAAQECDSPVSSAEAQLSAPVAGELFVDSAAEPAIEGGETPAAPGKTEPVELGTAIAGRYQLISLISADTRKEQLNTPSIGDWLNIGIVSHARTEAG
jgi:hypothetical protein